MSKTIVHVTPDMTWVELVSLSGLSYSKRPGAERDRYSLFDPATGEVIDEGPWTVQPHRFTSFEWWFERGWALRPKAGA